MSGAPPRRALVIGLGSSGVAAARLLAAEGWHVTVSDRAGEGSLGARRAELPEGVETVLGGHPTELLDGTHLVVASPGVRWDLPLLVEARRRGIEAIAEIELAWRRLAGTPLVGITGSNGKTTTTALVGAMLGAAGLRTAIGGNIGHPATDHALLGTWDALVWELSSFQLEGCSTLRPKVGVLLNLSPDHLDRHPTLAAYLAAKTRLFARQSSGDVAIASADDPGLADFAVPSRLERFSLLDRSAAAHLAGGDLVLDGAPLLPRAELPLPGDHNVANALAAALAASRMGAGREAIASALREFHGLPHRHRVVATVAGVRFVDDSKGTNIGATAAGLASYPTGTVHLILGGLGKGQDFTELRPALTGQVRAVYLIGEAAEEIAAALAGSVALEPCGTLAAAIELAAARAQSGDVVLLSPACASFDQFRDYAHRGDEFARIARALPGAEG